MHNSILFCNHIIIRHLGHIVLQVCEILQCFCILVVPCSGGFVDHELCSVFMYVYIYTYIHTPLDSNFKLRNLKTCEHFVVTFHAFVYEYLVKS